MSERFLHSLAVIKAVAYGGPVAISMAVIGSAILGLAFFHEAGPSYDLIVVGAVTLVVLGWVEIALARRFKAHEIIEERQYKYVANIADTAAGAIGEFARVTREHAAAVDSFRTEVVGLRWSISTLDERVRLIEERYMRPGLTLPRKPPGGND